jgi:DNA-binding SARP family transcriptional activator
VTRADAPNEGSPALLVLGRIELEKGGRAVEPILAQPKRLGLLVYLALRNPGGFVTRDELLGIFWPESTEHRARAALRQGLRFLRGHLGGAVIANRGDAEVGIPSGAMTCDVVEFARALEVGDDAAGVERYGGDLLPGFILSGAYEFDRWLQAERRALRMGAVQAALRLAGKAESDGDLAAAAERVRWAFHLDPTDEAVGRRLMALYARAGNRGAAAATYEALTLQLRDELDLDPSTETSDLMVALRKGGAALGEGGPERAGGAGGGGLSPRRVLVLPLEDLTNDPALASIGRLAADVVAQRLVGVPDLEVVPPVATLGASGVDGEEGGSDGAKERGPKLAGLALARRTGAGTLVEGTYHVEGGRLHLRPRITDVVHGRLLERPDPVIGHVSAPLDLVTALGDRVAATLAPILTLRAVHVRQAARPPSLEAYSAYLQGLERFIRGEWRDALIHFRRSASLEPSYALPRIVCAIAHWNLMELTEARVVATEATALRDSLGRFERALLDMVLAWLDGDWAAAHAAAREQADLAPGSIPHFQVAEEARRLNRPREAREVLRRLDPESGELQGWIFYWVELTLAHHLLGDHGRELELASHCRRLHSDDPVGALLEVRALAALGRREDLVRVLERSMATPGRRDPNPGSLLLEAALELQAHGGADAAKPIFDRAVAWYADRADGDGSERNMRDRARMLYYAGHLDEAATLFTRLFKAREGGVAAVGYHHGHLQAHLDQGYLAVISERQGERQEAERWSRHLESLEHPFLYGAQWFWLAAVAAERDEPDRVVRLLRRAFAEGLPHESFIHTDPHLARLRGHESFDALMRPRD